MQRIRLLPIDHALLTVLERGADAFEAAYGAGLGEMRETAREVVRQMLALPPTSDPRWGGYLAVDEQSRDVVGTGGFKSAPTPEGEVEIAYFTFPPFEGRGYATALARRLVDLAWSSEQVSRVLAHTLPEPNASGRVLTKTGLRRAGDAYDPEDGHVWRWVVERSPGP